MKSFLFVLAIVISTVLVCSSTSGARPSLPERGFTSLLLLPSEPYAPDGDLRIEAFSANPLAAMGSVTLWVRGEQDAGFEAVAMQPNGSGAFVAILAPWPSRGELVTYYATAGDANGLPVQCNSTVDDPMVVPAVQTAVAAPVTAPTRKRPVAAGIVALVSLLAVTFILVRSLFTRTPRRTSPTSRPARERGFTLAELTVTVALLGLAVLMGAIYLQPIEAPLRTGGERFEGLLMQARAKAIGTTTSYRVRPVDATRLTVETGDSCTAATWSEQADLALDFPTGVELTTTSWSLCFDSRGIASENLILTLAHPQLGSKDLEALRGGLVRWPG